MCAFEHLVSNEKKKFNVRLLVCMKFKLPITICDCEIKAHTHIQLARTHAFIWNKVYFLRPFETQFPFDACVWVESYYFNTTSDEEIHHRLNRNKFNLNELISLSIGCVVVCEWKEREWKSDRLELLCFWNGMVVCYLNTHKFQIYL